MDEPRSGGAGAGSGGTQQADVFIDETSESSQPSVALSQIGPRVLHETLQGQLLEDEAKRLEAIDAQAAGRLWAELARLQFRLGERDACRAAIGRALGAAPKAPAVLEASLVVAARSGFWSETSRLLEARAAIASGTEGAQWLVMLAAVREHRLEAGPAARQAAREALERAPGYSLARWALFRASDAPAGGGSDLDSAIGEAQGPSRGELLSLAAVAAESAGDDSRAERLYREAAEAGSPSARSSLGRLLARLGRGEDARALGDGAGASALLGAHAPQVDSAARADLERLLGDEPTHPAALAALQAIEAKGGHAEAIEAILRRRIDACQPGPDRASLYYALGELYNGPLGRPDDAANAYTHAVEDDPGYTPAFAALSRCREVGKNPAALLVLLRREVEATTDSRRRAAALCRVGALLREMQPPRIDEAIDAYKQARSLAPDLVAPFVALERVLTNESRWRELGELYESELGRVTDARWRTALLERVAVVWEDRVNDVSCAILTYQRLLEINADHPGALLGLSRLYGRTGEWEDLVEVLERLAALEKEGERHLSFLQAACELTEEQLRDPDRAIALYRKAALKAPAEHPIVAALGRLLDARGKWEELCGLYKRQISQVPADRAVQWNIRMAQVLDERLGRPEQALVHAKAALAADPGSRPALDMVERLLTSHGQWDQLVQQIDRQLEKTVKPQVRADCLRRMAAITDLHMKRPSEAADLYKRAVAEGSSAADLRRALRRCLASAARWGELIDVLVEDATDLVGEERLSRLRDAASLAMRPGVEPRKALAALRELVATAPEDATALASLARIEASLGMWTACTGTLRHLTQAAKADELRAGALFDLAALCDHRLHRPDAAALACKKLLEIMPDDGAARLTLDRTAHRARDQETLCEHLRGRVARSKTPAERLEARLSLSDALVAASRDAEALAEVDSALAENPGDLVLLTRRESILAAPEQGAAAFAAALERTAVALPPEKAGDWLLRSARQYLEADDPAASERVIEKLAAMTPDVEVLDLWADILTRRGDWPAVVKTLQRAESVAPNRAQAASIARRLGEVYRDRLSDPKGAISAFTRALVGGSPDPAVLQALADLNVRLGQWNEAFALYRELARSATELAVRKDSLRKLRDAHDKLGEEREGLEALRELVKLDPDDPASVESLLSSCAAMGLWEEAAALSEKLIGMIQEPRQIAAVLARLADIRERKGDAAEAEQAIRRAVAVAPEAPAVLERFEKICAAKGQWAELADAIRRAIERAAGETGPAAADRHFRLALLVGERLGDEAGALAHLKTARDLDPTSSAVLQKLSPALEKAGDVEAAIRVTRELCAAAPRSVEAYRRLHKLATSKSDEDTAFTAGACLVAVEAADETETYFHRQLRPRLQPAPSAALDPVSALLAADPGDPMELVALLRAVSPVLDRIFPPTLGEYGLRPEDALAGDSPLLVRRAADQVAKLVGARPFKLYVWPTSGLRVTVEPTPVPSIVVSQAACDAPGRELLFALGRAMARVAQESAAFEPGRIVPLGSVELGALCLATRRLAGQGVEVKARLEPIVADLAKKLAAELDQKGRAAVEVAAKALPEDLDPGAALDAMERSATRIGLVLSGDVASAAAHLRRRSDLGPDAAKARIEELCAFWMSARAQELRSRIGYSMR